MARARESLASARRASPRAGPRLSGKKSADAPQSGEAEISVLGALILNNELIDVVIPLLTTDAFFSEVHQKIYAAILALHEERRAVDFVTIRDKLKKRNELEFVGGNEYVTSLAEMVPAAVNIEHYAEIVREKAIERDLIAAGREIYETAANGAATSRELLDEAQARIFKIAERGTRSDVAPMREALKAAFERLDQGREGMLTGIATGFSDLDEITSGLQNGELLILAARPSMGKTSVALNIIEHVGVDLHLPTVIFSLEMSREQLARNMLCSHARLDSHHLRRGRLNDRERQSLPLHVGALSEAPIFIDDSASLNCFELRAKVRRLKARENLKLAVVDYLQLMQGPDVQSREQQISAISRSLKGLAREMNIPVLAVAQLNRQAESRDDHNPRMADLRESGSLEQDADVVLLLHRPGYYTRNTEDHSAKIIVAKQRNGPTGEVNLTFLRQFMRFESSTEGVREF